MGLNFKFTYLGRMHGMVTNIRLPKLLQEGENCTIESLLA
jgi:hypothetical protein